MTNYYEILGVTENANLDEIKVAYKQLAKVYHPDLNPDVMAEEQFKRVAAAYNILSNPISRSKFDSALAQQRLANAQAYARAKRPYPPTYTYQKKAGYQKRAVQPVDKKTERLGTLYAVGIIAGIALITYLASSIISFYKAQQQETLIANCDFLLENASFYYDLGDQKAGLLGIDKLKAFVSEHPTVENYVTTKIKECKQQAQDDLKIKAYDKAIWNILAYLQYTGDQDKDLLYDLAIAYRAVKEYEKAVYILNNLLNNNYRRMYTLSLMAEIYHRNLSNRPLALKYYNMALANIEYEFKATYGNAYRLLVSEERTPYIYKKIYWAAAGLNFELGEFSKARKLLEWVIFFEPDKARGYELLVKTYLNMGRDQAACKVINKAENHQINLDYLKVHCHA